MSDTPATTTRTPLYVQLTSMEAHPSYSSLSPFLKKYPHTAGPLFQTYNDLTLAQQWQDVQMVELESCARYAIRGRRPGTLDVVLNVVPCSLTESLSLSWLQGAFTALLNPTEVYLAITSDDSSTVYYKVSSGIVKPPI